MTVGVFGTVQSQWGNIQWGQPFSSGPAVLLWEEGDSSAFALLALIAPQGQSLPACLAEDFPLPIVGGITASNRRLLLLTVSNSDE